MTKSYEKCTTCLRCICLARFFPLFGQSKPKHAYIKLTHNNLFGANKKSTTFFGFKPRSVETAKNMVMVSRKYREKEPEMEKRSIKQQHWNWQCLSRKSKASKTRILRFAVCVNSHTFRVGIIQSKSLVEPTAKDT